MNPFLFTIVALCLAQGAVAQYGYQQRKMAPSPQQYGAVPAAAPSSYSAQSYEAPSSSSYEERTPAASSYGKQQMSSYSRPQSSYGQQQASSYGQQQQSYGQQSYAKQAPAKYEPEPSYPPMPFSWGYDLSDGYGAAQYHKETGDEYGKRVGSYGYTDAYGIYRQVDYVADEHGFHATVKSNEPGLQKGQESPASTEFVVYEPPSNYYAGNTNSYSLAAPSSGYAKQSSGYGASSSGSSSSYSAPASQNYASQSYSAPQQSYKSAPSYKSAAPAYQSTGSQYASASSSAPTYQKAASAAPAKAY